MKRHNQYRTGSLHRRRAILLTRSVVFILMVMLSVPAISAGAAKEDLSVVLIKDINPGPVRSNPTSLTNINGTLYFQAEHVDFGDELWKSDGTTAGTVLVKDIYPGPAGSSQPTGFIDVNGTTFFIADDGVHGRELWKTDGTEAGTMLVKDINPGAASSSPGQLTVFKGELYFAARDGVTGYELWKSDGTAAGTVMVKDINPGSANSSPGFFTVLNGALYFRADDGVKGLELWKSDGTAAGTVLVKDIRPGIPHSRPFNFAVFAGELYFSADDGVTNDELWKSDGTAAGTVLVKDINPGTAGSSPRSFTVFKGELYFAAGDGVTGYELWKSDGTAAGTVLVKDINPGTLGSNPGFFAVFNGTLFFRADDGVTGGELWKTDGTNAGTVLVKDINPTGSSDPIYLTELSGRVFFRAFDGVDEELWQSDGTLEGTRLFKDINPDGFSHPTRLTEMDGKLFFRAEDSIRGRELWALVPPREVSKSNETGSLLVFPLIDNINGVTIINIANLGTVAVDIECYSVTHGPEGGIDQKNDFTITLTPKEKFVWLSNQPYDQRGNQIGALADRKGYMFCWAIDNVYDQCERPYDYLKGDVTCLSLADARAFNYNAITHQTGMGFVPDKVLKLNGTEYTAGSSQILFEGLAEVPGAIGGTLVVANPGIDFVESKQPEFDINVFCWNEVETKFSRHLMFKDFEQYDLTKDLQLDIASIFTLGFHCATTSSHALWAVFQQDLGTIFGWGGNVWQHPGAPIDTEIRLPGSPAVCGDRQPF